MLFDLPEELSGQVTAVVTGHFTDEIVTYYYTPEFNEEEMENDYLKSRFFTVQRVTPGEFEDEYNNHVTVGYLSFPGRDSASYYVLDDANGGVVVDDVYGYDQVATALTEWVEGLFAADDAITPIDLSDTPFVDDFSYSGNHIDVTVWPYGDSDDPDAPYWTLVLSQPATQGDGGIWCVERGVLYR